MAERKGERQRRKGLTDTDIQQIIDFDWDKSSDEEDVIEDEYLPEILEKNIEEIIANDQEIEVDIIDQIISNRETDNIEESATANPVEKIDSKNLKWRNKSMEAVDTTWKEEQNSDAVVLKSPFEYYSDFLDDELFELIADQTNLYALQEKGIELKCQPFEIRRYIGTLLYLGIVKLPDMRMAWSNKLKLSPISDSLSRNRFEKIKQFFHFNDNSKQPEKGHPNYNKLYKLQPLLSVLKKKFNALAQEEHQSVDESIIAFKGRSSLKQYNPAKPHKWGFKMFTRAGSSGMVYDFALYVGEGTCPSYGLGISSDIVLYLTSTMPKLLNYKLYFDNWFTSISLMMALKEMGIFSTGTVRQNRVGNCDLLSEKELKKRGRGSYDQKCEINYNIAVVRWFDNKSVQMLSTFANDQPLTSCKRWNAQEKQFIEIQRPAMISEYNKHMGGVDLFDMLMELYKINHKSTKWYRRIAYWCIGAAVVNAWLLYRQHLKIVDPGCKHMPLVDFQLDIAQSLLSASSTPCADITRKRGRPSMKEFDIQPQSSMSSASATNDCSEIGRSSSRKRKYTPDPSNTMRYDKLEHMVVWGEKGRCRFCKTATPLSTCSKCKVHLCSNTNKNCFYSYHC